MSPSTPARTTACFAVTTLPVDPPTRVCYFGRQRLIVQQSARGHAVPFQKQTRINQRQLGSPDLASGMPKFDD
eukprot:4559904-Pleurochrysis_carterae.AAC.2